MSSELSDVDSIVIEDMESTIPATSSEKPASAVPASGAANTNASVNNPPWTDHEIQVFRDVLKAQWEKEKTLELGKRTPAGKLFPFLAQELKNRGVNRNFESLKKRWYKKTRYEKEFQNTFDFSTHAVNVSTKNGDESVTVAEDTDQSSQKINDLQSLVARASAEYFSVPRSSAPRQPIIPRPTTEASPSYYAVWTEESSEKLCKVLTAHWKIEKKLAKRSNGKELFTKVSEDLRKLGVRMNSDQCRKRWYRHLRDLPEWKNTFDFSLNSGFNNYTEKASTKPSSSPTREGSASGSAGEGVKRFTYSVEQKRVLTAEGKKSLFPTQTRREALAAQLKLPVKMISKWFATCRRGYHGFKAVDKQDSSQKNRRASDFTTRKRSRTSTTTVSEFADSGCALNDSDEEYNGERAPKRSRQDRFGDSSRKNLNTTSLKSNVGKKTKQRFLDHELVYLVAQCNKNNKPSMEEKERIAEHLGLELKRVIQWYTNANYGFYGFGAPGSFEPYSTMYSSVQNNEVKGDIVTPSKRRHSRRSVVPDDSDEDLPDPSLIIESGGRTRKSTMRPEYVPSAHLDANNGDVTEEPLSLQENTNTAPDSARSSAAVETKIPKPRFFARKGPRVAPFDEPQPILKRSVDPITRPASESYPLRSESVSTPQPQIASEPNTATSQQSSTASSPLVDFMTSTIAKLETLNKEIDPLESSLLVTKMEIKEIDMKMQKLEQLKKNKEAKRIEVVTQLKDKKRKKESLEGVLEAFRT